MCVLTSPAGISPSSNGTITIGTQIRPSIKVTYPRHGTVLTEGCAFHDGADGFYMEEGVLYITQDGVNVAAYREWTTVEKIGSPPAHAPYVAPYVAPPLPWTDLPGTVRWPRPTPPYWVTNSFGLKAVCGHDVSECPCRAANTAGGI